jgi:hypothetical protein
VIVWWLDLQLPVQSVPIITNIVSSNPVHGEVTTLCDKSLRVTSTGRWFSLDTPVSSNKTDRHDINDILLKVALNSISLNFNVIKHSLETTSS